MASVHSLSSTWTDAVVVNARVHWLPRQPSASRAAAAAVALLHCRCSSQGAWCWSLALPLGSPSIFSPYTYCTCICIDEHQPLLPCQLQVAPAVVNITIQDPRRSPGGAVNGSGVYCCAICLLHASRRHTLTSQTVARPCLGLGAVASHRHSWHLPQLRSSSCLQASSSALMAETAQLSQTHTSLRTRSQPAPPAAASSCARCRTAAASRPSSSTSTGECQIAEWDAVKITQLGKERHGGRLLVLTMRRPCLCASGGKADALPCPSYRQSDLAVLHISATSALPVAKLGKSSALRAGEWVIALGSPLHLSNRWAWCSVAAAESHLRAASPTLLDARVSAIIDQFGAKGLRGACMSHLPLALTDSDWRTETGPLDACCWMLELQRFGGHCVGGGAEGCGAGPRQRVHRLHPDGCGHGGRQFRRPPRQRPGALPHCWF